LARAAFKQFSRYIDDRLWQRHTTYPRTFVAKVTPDVAQQRGRLTAEVQTAISRFESEPRPWYWPHDVAGRA
jgi:hypothetical protein